MERRCKIDSICVDQNKVNIDQNIETTKHDKYVVSQYNFYLIIEVYMWEYDVAGMMS